MFGPTEAFVAHLDSKVDHLLGEIERSEVLRTIVSPETSTPLLVAIIRNILLETYSYGGHISSAACTAIGRMAYRHHHMMQPLMAHVLEEVAHPTMALTSCARLGGDEDLARSQRIGPASFAAAAVVRMLAEHESPFSYLGYIYLLEGTTAVVAVRMQEALEAKDVPVEFISEHAAADEEHAQYVREQIRRVVDDEPEQAAAIEYGFDCFAGVYPHPIWAAALERAKREAS